MEVQDVITFKPERAKVIKDPKIIDTLKDPNHWPILKALRKGPMTIRELEKEIQTAFRLLLLIYPYN